MENKKIFVRQYTGYGDWISLCGLVRFLCSKYDEVNIIIDLFYYDFIKNLYKDENKINLVSLEYFVKYIENNDDYDYLDLLVSNFSENIKENHFNTINQIGVKFGFPFIKINPKWFLVDGYPANYNRNIKKILENNASSFYASAGIPKEYRVDKFDYVRDHDDENNFFQSLNLPEKYIVVSEYDINIINRKYIKNKNLPIININNLSKKYWDIIKVLEKAEEVHLLENSTSLMVYHLQYKNIMEKVPVDFHTYARRDDPGRKCISEEVSNIFMDMVMCPKLKNWNFIYENISKNKVSYYTLTTKVKR